MCSVLPVSSDVASMVVAPEKYVILKRHASDYGAFVMECCPHLPSILGDIVADFVAEGELMDRKSWLEYFGVDIGPENPNIREALKFDHFYQWYHGPDPRDVWENVPVERVRRVCETCLIPTVVPQNVRFPNGNMENYTLNILAEIAANPVKGFAATCDLKLVAQYVSIESEARPAKLVVLLNGIVGRNKPWFYESPIPAERGQVQILQDLKRSTGYECEIEPDLLSQNTVLLAHYVATGERAFGNPSGLERQWTYGMVRDELNVPAIKGPVRLSSGGFVNETVPKIQLIYALAKGSFNCSDSIGVGILRKF